MIISGPVISIHFNWRISINNGFAAFELSNVANIITQIKKSVYPKACILYLHIYQRTALTYIYIYISIPPVTYF